MSKKFPKDRNVVVCYSINQNKVRYATRVDEFLGETCLPFMAGVLTVLGFFTPLIYIIQHH